MNTRKREKKLRQEQQLADGLNLYQKTVLSFIRLDSLVKIKRYKDFAFFVTIVICITYGMQVPAVFALFILTTAAFAACNYFTVLATAIADNYILRISVPQHRIPYLIAKYKQPTKTNRKQGVKIAIIDNLIPLFVIALSHFIAFDIFQMAHTTYLVTVAVICCLPGALITFRYFYDVKIDDITNIHHVLMHAKRN